MLYRGLMDSASNQNHAAVLGTIEVGLGSILHTFHIPMAGHFLSLNQGIILTDALRRDPDRASPAVISNIAAVLKSASPAANKLGPMVSLSAQGLLYSIGVIIFGAGPFGVSVGMVLLSSWAFVQPLVTYYLIFGKSFYFAVEQVVSRLGEFVHFNQLNWVRVLVLVVSLKALVAVVGGLLAFYLPESLISRYKDRLAKIGGSVSAKQNELPDISPTRGALRDISRPIFLISVLITVAFAFFSDRDYSKLIWIGMRPIAFGFVIFYLLRSPGFMKWFKDLLRIS